MRDRGGGEKRRESVMFFFFSVFLSLSLSGFKGPSLNRPIEGVRKKLLGRAVKGLVDY